MLFRSMARLDVDRIAAGFRRVGGDEAAAVARAFWSGDPGALNAYAATCLPLYSPTLPDPAEMTRTRFNTDLLSDPAAPMRGIDLRSGLASVSCPTLVVAGEDDPVCTIEGAEEIVAALPGDQVRFERFAGAGHFCHLDDPERFFTLLGEFLA